MTAKKVLPLLLALVAVGLLILTTVESKPLSAQHQPLESQPKFLVYSNTTLSVNVATSVVNNSTLSFAGWLRQDPSGLGVENVTLNITWNDNYIDNTTTFTNGKFKFNFTASGKARYNHTLNMSFAGASINGTTYLNASWNETNITVKHQVLIEITNLNTPVTVGQQLMVIGLLKDDEEVTLANETVELYLDGVATQATTITDTNGYFTVNYSIPLDTSASVHYASIFHPNSTYYLEGESVISEITVKRTTKIILIPKTVARNISAEINGTLVDNMVEPVAGANINISWNKTYLNTTKTDEHGVFSFGYHVDGNHPLGETEVNAVFNDSDFYTSSSNTANYTVTRGAAIIMESKNVFRNTTAEINGRLVNDAEEGIIGNVSIYWNNALIEDNPTTNTDGTFSYNYFVNANHSLGNINVTVKFSGNDLYPPSEKTVNYTVRTHTDILIFPKTLRRGEFAEINGTLVDDMGNGFQGLVTISWNNTDLDSIITDENGNFSLRHQVKYNHHLGSVTVNASFNASELYGASSNTTIYSIVSNTTIILESKNVFRNTTTEIKGRIVDDQGTGAENLMINITSEDNYNITYSNDSGFFSITHNIPANHSLGNLSITAAFKGSDIYLPSSAAINCSVFSNTTITMFSKTVFKGGCAEINGSLVDDNGLPVKGLLNIYWDDEYKGNTASNDGFFTFHHNVSLNQSVGIIEVAVVFPETGFYISSNNTVKYTIVANTTITFSVGELVRGESFTIMGELFENCSGQKGAPGAKRQISITLTDLLIGSVFTETNGGFMFMDAVPTVSRLGNGTINVIFNGSLYLKPSNASVTVNVKERITIMINVPGSVVENEMFECEIILSEKISNLTISVTLQGEGRIKVDNKELNITKNNPHCFNLTTDKDGKASFSILVKFAGTLTINASFQGKEYFTGATSGKTVFILKKQVEEKQLWLYFLIIPVLCLPGLGYYVLRRRRLSKMRKIIVEARGELAAGSEYVRTILLLYKKLCDHLKKYGFIRKKFETFREFENGVRKALPVDREHLNKFITIIEEVRYSSHEIGPQHRDEAIKNFTVVENSLKTILGGET